MPIISVLTAIVGVLGLLALGPVLSQAALAAAGSAAAGADRAVASRMKRVGNKQRSGCMGIVLLFFVAYFAGGALTVLAAEESAVAIAVDSAPETADTSSGESQDPTSSAGMSISLFSVPGQSRH